MIGICGLLLKRSRTSGGLGPPKTGGVLVRTMEKILDTKESQRSKMLAWQSNLPIKRHPQKALAWPWARASKSAEERKANVGLGLGLSWQSNVPIKRHPQKVLAWTWARASKSAEERKANVGLGLGLSWQSNVPIKRHPQKVLAWTWARASKSAEERKPNVVIAFTFNARSPYFNSIRVFSTIATQHIHIDWRDKNVLIEVREQKCGSCYAMAALCTVEALWKLKRGVLQPLSVQELIDCSTNFGNRGCLKGEAVYCYNYIKWWGICSERDYPYTGQNGYCDYLKRRTLAAYIEGYTSFGCRFGDLRGYEDAILKALYEQPLAFCIYVSTELVDYEGARVIHTWTPLLTGDIHWMVLVGAKVMDGINVWVVRNSWGKSWGEQEGICTLAGP